jgi:hypothetical protein
VLGEPDRASGHDKAQSAKGHDNEGHSKS